MNPDFLNSDPWAVIRCGARHAKRSKILGFTRIALHARFNSSLMLALLLAAAMPLVAQARDLQADLARFNRLKLSAEARLFPPGNGLTEAFKNESFVCRHQRDHLPVEGAAAKEAVGRFVNFARANEGNLGDEGQQRRVDVLSQADKAGSWRARYFTAMRHIFLFRNEPQGRAGYDQLFAMAQSGNPAALAGVLHWSGGMYDDMPQRILILKAAIERGNSKAMATVGFDLSTRSIELRPKGLAMLQCAVDQGGAEAFEGLGRVAWLEGRWVDAYRTWLRGANLGCESCLMTVDTAMRTTKADYDPDADMYRRDSKAELLRKFYADQSLYSVSLLDDLRVEAPAKMWLEWSDLQLVQMLETKVNTYGIP